MERPLTEAIEATRRRLRSGILPVELLTGGAEIVLRSGERPVTRDELRAEAEQVAGGLRLPRNAMGKVERSRLRA